ncbi:MAG: glycosyltransferase family 39 protein [Chloroflexota bacterium]
MLAGICLAAFILRAWRLDFQSFWQDEGFSVSLSGSSVSYILQQSFTVEPNPPLYFLLLHFWRLPAGGTEYAIRFLSLLPSVLTVPAMFLLGRRLWSARLGLLAAALAAVSPFLVWLAQEARMYTWEALWLTLGAWCLLRGLRAGRPTYWVLFASFNLLAVYSHLYAVFVVAAEALLLAVTCRRAWRRGALAIGVPLALFVPWFVSVSAYSGESSTWRGFIGVWDMIRVLLLNAASQGHLPGSVGSGFSLLLGLAIILGVGVLVKARPWSGWLLASWLLLPVAAVYALSFKEPLFSPRYFIVIMPALLLLAAAAVAALPGRVALLGLALLSAGSIWAVERGNTVPAYAKEDYRLAGTYISARTDPGDVVLLVANYIVYPFQYYFHGPGTLLPLNVEPESDVAPLLAPLAAEYDHIWLVEAHDVFVDPHNHVASWLRARYSLADERYITGIHFMEFDPHAHLASLPTAARPLHIQWAGGPELAGYQLRGGNPSGIRLFWKANGQLAANYHLSLKLWSASGKLAGQQDGEPLNAGLRFGGFPGTGYIRDDHYISAAPGTYDLRLSVYLHQDLPIQGQHSSQVDFGQVSVPTAQGGAR